MSTQIFPTLIGQGWSVSRAPQWMTKKQQNVSGREISVAYWGFPRYIWSVTFNVLRTGLVNGDTWTEMQQLMGFYNQRQGAQESFLYLDAYDHTSPQILLGTGSGSKVDFQLARVRGTAVPHPIYAPNLSLPYSVYVDGTLQNPLNYTITPWDTASSYGPGKVVFNSPPALGSVISAIFSYYWPCTFVEDLCEFEKFLQGYYKVQQLSFASIK